MKLVVLPPRPAARQQRKSGLAVLCRPKGRMPRHCLPTNFVIGSTAWIHGCAARAGREGGFRSRSRTSERAEALYAHTRTKH